MFCNQCGQELPDTSRFCNVCGSTVVAKSAAAAGGGANPPIARESAAPAAHENRQPLAPGEMLGEKVIFVLRPTLVFVLLRYILATLIVVAVAALMGILSKSVDWLTGQIAFFVILGTGVVVFINPVYKHILRRCEIYTLTNYKLEMRSGFIAKKVRNIPLDKIQDVTVTAAMWQRLANLGDIVIDSASEDGKIHLDDIHRPERYADLILNELRQRN
ncbi:MAG: PH domain-containing protein [Blastocatellia bacterium]|nr:PH domain-containing protein [Blastocatellia bacterium]